ncbi:MAG: NifB/NifX family molybdenum-iron cluster-binding protein [Gammaproteobacteria bacterium]|jgi:predicted Fe-Mo cluster-binding NifX family protein
MIRALSLVTLLGLTLAVAVAAEEPGDYKPDTFAISADGSELTSPISKLSGVSPYYHLYSVNGKAVEVLANPHLDLEFGIGPAAAATLADKGVTVLVGGMAGPKMQDVLDARSVRFVRRTGTVEDVVKELSE